MPKDTIPARRPVRLVLELEADTRAELVGALDNIGARIWAAEIRRGAGLSASDRHAYRYHYAEEGDAPIAADPGAPREGFARVQAYLREMEGRN